MVVLTVAALGAVSIGWAARTGSADDKTAKKSPAKAARTYAKDVAPILNAKCAVCHRPGEVAPFSLLSFKDSEKRAKQIAAVVKSKFMPPWKADSHGEFLNERKLTESEIETITQWAENGAAEGDPKAAPPAPKFPAGWKLGKPDMLAQLPEPFKLDAEGRDVYRCFVVPVNNADTKWLAGMEVQPDNRKIVHHVIAYLDTTGAARKLDEKDPGAGYATQGGGPGFIPTAFIGGWAPGNESVLAPPGFGMEIPKNADIVLEVHYHKSGKPEVDQTKTGLYWAKGPVHQRLRILVAINPVLNIPAGSANHLVTASTPITKDITLTGITPHMHLVGKSMNVVAKLPDGTTKKLVNVPDWDFNWQTLYLFKDPVKLPAGTVINLEARYDNSTSNPRNPNSPPKKVTWGEQTTDEMCIAFLGFLADGEDIQANKRIGKVSLYEIGKP
jgi:hypothetical protein